MKVFILLSLACLAVSLPIYAGTGQADLNLPDSVYESGNKENSIPFTQRIKAHPALADPTSLPAPTAATPSNAALFKRRGLGVMLKPWLMYHRPYRRPSRVKPSKTPSKEPSKTPSEEPSKDHLALADPTSLPAPIPATPSNAALFRRRWLAVWLSRPKPRPSPA